MARRGQVSDGDMAAGRYNGASAISQPLIINGGLNWQLFSSIRLTVYIVLDMSTAYPATNPHYRICTLHSYIVLYHQPYSLYTNFSLSTFYTSM